MTGRPSKLTDDRRERCLDALRLGATRRLAAARAGISEDTLARWLRRYADFAEMAIARETEGELLLVGKVQECAVGGSVIAREVVEKLNAKGQVISRVTKESYQPADGRLGLEILARRHPDEWGRKDAVEVTLKDRIRTLAAELGLPYDVVLAEAQRQALSSVGPRALPASRNGAA